MSKTKIKKPALPIIHTVAEAEALVNEIATIKLSEQGLVSSYDLEAMNLAARYEPSLAPLRQALNEKAEVLERWAAAHPEEFGNRKSIEFTSGTIGFRTGTPKCKLLKKWNWDLVLAAIKARFKGSLSDYFVRTKEEVDKEAILGEYAAKGVDKETLAQVGVEVVQEESFYVDPKLTEVEIKTVIPQAAA